MANRSPIVTPRCLYALAGVLGLLCVTNALFWQIGMVGAVLAVALVGLAFAIGYSGRHQPTEHRDEPCRLGSLVEAKTASTGVADQVTDGIVVLDAEMRIRYLNPSAAMLIGVDSTRDSDAGRREQVEQELNPRRSAHIDDHASFSMVGRRQSDPSESLFLSDLFEFRLASIQIDETHELPESLRMHAGHTAESHPVSGKLMGVRLSRWVELDEGDRALQPAQDRGFLLVLRDETGSDALQRLIDYHAAHDPLTGLANRREFERRLELAASDAGGLSSAALTVMSIAVDQYHQVHVNCGPDAGDALLGYVADTLNQRLRESDTICRIRGDEFMAMLEDCDVDAASEVGEELARRIGDSDFTWADQTYTVSLKIGIAQGCASGSHRPRELMDNAVLARQVAGESGNEPIQSYSTADPETAAHRNHIRMRNEVQTAVTSGSFALHLHPIHPASASTAEHPLPTMGEILLRMIRPDGSQLSPRNFLSSAERYGLMPQIDRWVIQTTFSKLHEKPELFKDHQIVTINISGQTISTPGTTRFLMQAIDEFHLDPTRLCFEITESAMVEQWSVANQLLGTLRERGVAFALDDFGTGYSSFAYLKLLPADYIKIDGSFVREAARNTRDRATVRAIIDLAKEYGALTIAEFVESEAILQVVRELGTDYVQGALIGDHQPLL